MGSTLSIASNYSKDDTNEHKDGRKKTKKVLYTPDTGFFFTKYCKENCIFSPEKLLDFGVKTFQKES